MITSYVFSPIAFIMGVDFDDCRRVAELIGLKTFLNEFVAYVELSKYIKNQQNLTWYEYLPYNTSIVNNTYSGNWTLDGNDIHYLDFNHTLVGGVLTVRWERYSLLRLQSYISGRCIDGKMGTTSIT